MTQANDNVTFDSPQAGNDWGTRSTCHWSNGDIKGRAGWSSAIICKLTMVEIAFEDDQI